MSIKLNAQKVRQLRKDLLWSQEDLAQGSGLSVRTIQRIEKNAIVSVDTLQSLAAAFNIPADDLVHSPELDGLRIGTFLGFLGASIGAACGTFGVFTNVMKGGMSGHQAAIYMGAIGIISGLSFAFIGIMHYLVVRDREKRDNEKRRIELGLQS